MPETSTAPVTPGPVGTPAAPTTPPLTPAPRSPYAAATAELANAGTWDAITTPAPTTEATPSGPDGAAPAVESTAEGEEAPASPTPTFDGWTVDASGRLHRPDGTFAEASEIAAYNAEIPASEGDAAPEGEPPAEPAPEPIRVALKGRNGEETEIEVDDPALAEILRANAKDGMRRDEFHRRMATVEAKEQEYKQFETLLQTNPEYVVMNLMPEAKRIALTTALVAQYWDQVAPTLVQFDQTPEARVRTAAETQIAMRDQMRGYEQQVAANQQAMALADAVHRLLPESVDPQTEDSFLADAETDIRRAVERGERVTPETVPQILARRLALYGLTTEPNTPVPARPRVRAVAAPSAQPTGTTPSAARPVGAKAEALAAAKAEQARLQQAQTTRRRAAAMPPAGAGAAPVRGPAVPPGTTIKDASRQLKQLKSW